MVSKRRPKVIIVCAGRRPPHPWEATGESVLVGRYLGNGENGEPAKKTIQNDIQNHQKSMKMGPQIHAKSMKNQGCVADAILERFGCVPGGARQNSLGQNDQKVALFGIFFGSLWRQFSIKNLKKAFKNAFQNRCRKRFENQC